MKYTIHYTLRADGPEGEVIEATVPEEPFTFEAGAEEILEDLEAAVTGAAVLGGVGLAHVVNKLREHRLPGATSHAGSGPRYSHRHPAAERIWTPGGGWTTSSGVPVDGR